MAADGYEATAVGASRKRTRLTRTYPVHTLEEALAVPTAVYEANSGVALRPRFSWHASWTRPLPAARSP